MNSLLSLDVEYCILHSDALCTTETPFSILCCHYQDILQSLHPSEVANAMMDDGLLNRRYYKLILDAPCDYIRSKMIFEQIRQKETSCLFVFLDILRRSGNHEYIYDTLTIGNDKVVCLTLHIIPCFSITYSTVVVNIGKKGIGI